MLAVDHGERRVGLAISDPDYDFVRGLPTLDRNEMDQPLPVAIRDIVIEEEVDRVVVGIPYTLEGEEGGQARAARKFQIDLLGALDVPVDEWDERMTTEAARRALHETGHTEREMKGKLDQLAAVLMLEAYLRRAAR